jgi:hypothetical protein
VNNDRFKCRFYDKTCKSYVNPKYIKFYDNGCISIEDTWATGDIIIEQCTGLRDKNDVLIFEGDRLSNGLNIYTVYWKDAMFCYGDLEFVLGEFDTELEFEIIGNKWENLNEKI